jgi:PIN domain nuclease of toxin-antitoxin system
VVKLLTDPGTDVHLSAVSTWEIAIKAALGKIDV